MAYVARLRGSKWRTFSDLSVLGVLGGGFLIVPSPIWALFFYVTVIPFTVSHVWEGWRPDWRDPTTMLPVTLIVWSVATLLWSDPPLPHGISRWQWVWNGVCTVTFFLSTLSLAERSLWHRARIIDVLVLCGLANVLVTLAKFFLSANWDQRLAGWANTRNPSLGATIVGGCALLALSRCLHAERRRSLWAAVLIPFGVFMLLSESRGAMVFFAIASLPLFLLPRRAGRRPRVIIGAGAFATALLVGAAFAWWQMPWLMDLMRQMIDRPTYRLLIWRDTLPELATRLWFGHGPTAVLHDVSHLNVSFGPHPHDLYLGTILYSGLVGLILLLGCFAWLLSRLSRLPDDPERATAVALLLYPMLCGLTDLSQVIKGPSEMWYILWLPLLLSGAILRSRTRSALH